MYVKKINFKKLVVKLYTRLREFQVYIQLQHKSVPTHASWFVAVVFFRWRIVKKKGNTRLI